MRQVPRSFLFLFSVFFSLYTYSQKVFTVHADKPGAAIPATMWGIFFEDINFGADGGLYAELVKNRSFEFPMPMMGWRENRPGNSGKILIINQGNSKINNPRLARITVNGTSQPYVLTNEGFRGMGLHANESYQFSLLAKKREGHVKMRIELVSALGKVIGSAVLPDVASAWKKLQVSLHTSDSAEKGKLHLYFEGKGSVDVDMISLFPAKTWKNRPGGLRADLVQMLADLQPGFVRFPGGCIVEGRDLGNRYQWKTTVGPQDQRKLMMNRWNVEFPRRAAPDYYQTFGLGFYEYFLLSEDIGAEPLPILNCGMACQFNSGEVVPVDQLDPFIQDALDLIEFANGAVTTRWGKVRASMGHPKPFNLKYLGVGNEQWDEQYIERYKEFEKVLKKKYPAIRLVAAAGPSPDGPRFEYAWKELRKLDADLVDEHYYMSPEWFFRNAGRYDQYERKGPKVFAGEYAAHGREDPKAESRNTWLSALAEAAFMTGLERNADVVQMSSYAPLLAHVEAWQWRPDLIWFDNLRAVGTPNYYVQKMFANHKGTQVIPILESGSVIAGRDSLYASAVTDNKKKELVIKLVNASDQEVNCTLDINGKQISGPASMEQIASDELMAYNSVDRANTVVPVQRPVSVSGSTVKILLPPKSFQLIRLPLQN